MLCYHMRNGWIDKSMSLMNLVRILQMTYISIYFCLNSICLLHLHENQNFTFKIQ